MYIIYLFIYIYIYIYIYIIYIHILWLFIYIHLLSSVNICLHHVLSDREDECELCEPCQVHSLPHQGGGVRHQTHSRRAQVISQDSPAVCNFVLILIVTTIV